MGLDWLQIEMKGGHNSVSALGRHDRGGMNMALPVIKRKKEGSRGHVRGHVKRGEGVASHVRY